MAKGSTYNTDSDDAAVSKGYGKKAPKQNTKASKVNEKGSRKNPGKSGNGSHVVNSGNPFKNVLMNTKKQK